MKLIGIAAIVLGLTACDNLLQTLEGGSSSSSSTSGSGGGAAPAQGLNCGTDPDTSATLCLGSTICPGLVVDSEVFPGCGYRVNGSAVDIECSCSGWLCPLGATSCADAQQRLAAENYGVVCTQIAAGTCTQGAPIAPPPSSSSGSCDPSCRDDCDNVPSCLEACGC